MRYSIIVPVYNRPDEVDELLDSLTRQTFKDFEAVIVEDGSKTPCRQVCEKYSDRLDIHYHYKDNSGPGQSRNFGAEQAKGEYLVILDSDVVLPETYLEEVEKEICRQPTDAFGGPDCAHESFTDTQKAISYSMTSFFTTGGIRGGKHPARGGSVAVSPKALDKFYPRSFNMGIRKDVYQALGGFSKMRFGEDIDFSIRIFKAGYQCRLFPEAWVWHKRRTDFRKFFRQVFNSGIARINLYKRHPDSLKLVHLLPTVFTIGVCTLVLISAFGRIMMEYGDRADFKQWYFVCLLPWFPILLYCLLLFADSAYANRSVKIGFLSIGAAFVQLFGYGTGFIASWWQRCVLKRGEFQAFEQTFYK